MPNRRLSKDDFEALARFRHQLRRFLRFSEELTQAHGVPPLQYQLMLQIRGFPGRDWATVAELAERLQARHHGVVALVSRCEAAGHVRRVPSRDDRRRVEVHLTPQGRACVDRLARLHLVELQSAREGWAVPGIGAAAVAPTTAPGPSRRGC
jgi:DNA-binding MarR family transcriptional regulator